VFGGEPGRGTIKLILFHKMRYPDGDFLVTGYLCNRG